MKEKVLFEEKKYFEAYFKLNDLIIDTCMTRYKKRQKSNWECIFPTIDKKLLEKDSKELSKICDILDIYIGEVIFFGRGEMAKIIVTSEFIYNYNKREKIKISNIEFISETLIRDEATDVYISIVSDLMPMIKELKILNTEVNKEKNLHPLSDYNEKVKENHIKLLVAMACRFGTLTALQVTRLEQIARQFDISSEKLTQMISKELTIPDKHYKSYLKVLRDNRINYDTKILMVDFIVIDLLNVFNGLTSSFLFKKLSSVLDIEYSSFVQILSQVKAKIRENQIII